MRQRTRRSSAAPLFVAAAVAYTANVGLGTAVATKLIDTRNFRWVHHALYIATCVTTAAAAVIALFWARPRRASRRAALVLLPAAAPLAAIPSVRTHSRRHPLTALTAAPFILAGLVCSLRPANRK
jgi:hypothetical protein